MNKDIENPALPSKEEVIKNLTTIGKAGYITGSNDLIDTKEWKNVKLYFNAPILDSEVEEAIEEVDTLAEYGAIMMEQKGKEAPFINTIRKALSDKDRDITELSDIIIHNNELSDKNILELQSKLDKVREAVNSFRDDVKGQPLNMTAIYINVILDKINQILGGEKK